MNINKKIAFGIINAIILFSIYFIFGVIESGIYLIGVFIGMVFMDEVIKEKKFRNTKKRSKGE